MNCVFFWSEEQAREHRGGFRDVRGMYLTLEQSAYVTRSAQSALFAFPRQP